MSKMMEHFFRPIRVDGSSLIKFIPHSIYTLLLKRRKVSPESFNA